MPSQTALRNGSWGSIIHERTPEPVKETYTEMDMFMSSDLPVWPTITIIFEAGAPVALAVPP